MDDPRSPEDAVKEAADLARRRLESADAEMETRIKELEASARQARERHETNQTQQQASVTVADPEIARGAGLGLVIAYAVIGLPLLGFLIGYFIDGRLNGPIGGILGLVGALLGVAFAIYRVQTQAKR
ncbi:hypothetical protein CCB81_09445 [Armatimonadetes bacterium Uphvl-Ar2]|jgi:F0F1-type ATP synthase assembly protein I|nr:hypothetical protein CCB81_09445 [Armatimonadetes bacterium Uphvl-Ar2]